MRNKSSSIFQFKKFSVDQSGCGMKINTDGVLLAALTEACQPSAILDIGTGTGVMALMLAQRFQEALIEAVEIELSAAATAHRNFHNSIFSDRLAVFPVSFQEFLSDKASAKYDLIVSNPPFFLNSLKNNDVKKRTARHAEDTFFSDLMRNAASSLSITGSLWIILPTDTACIAVEQATAAGLNLQSDINVTSFPDSPPHRRILAFGRVQEKTATSSFAIYKQEKQYSEDYSALLRDFFTIF